MKTIIKTLSLVGIMLILTSCGKNDSKDSTGGTTTNQVTYYMNNGYCYNSSGQVVSNSYCSGTSSGYTLYNGVCYSSTGQAVNISYCSSSTSPISQSCVGTYYYCTAYGCQAGTCNGSNCSGYTLYNQQWQPVICQ